TIKKMIEYGSITEINVPIPIFLSYFCANAIMSAKYVMSGVMMFVVESAIRYAICVTSGEYPNCIIIGTNIGAIIAHFAEALPINKLMNAQMIIKTINNGITVKLMLSKKLAPNTPTSKPILLSAKNATNCPAVNASTINVPIVPIVLAKAFATSLSFLISFVTYP